VTFWRETEMDTIINYIGGGHVEPVGREYIEKIEPATGKVIAHVADSDGRDVDAAVEAAAEAFPVWSRIPSAGRSRWLLAIADRIDANVDRLAEAESADTGKPLRLAKTVDIPRAAANFRFFAAAVAHSHTEAYRMDGIALNYTLRQPRGVTGLISPWNLPLYLLSWKVAPALATGNTVVAKPSELTPTTADILTELCIEVGLPPGVFNVVHGTGAKAGAVIVAHPIVPTISFTGGTKTGAEIARTAAPMFKKIALELGGKNPTLIFADTDLDEAMPTIVRSAFENQGQICLCGSRILVEEKVYPDFLERFVAATRRLKVGDPLDSDCDQGAVISSAHFEKIMGYIRLAREEGGKIVCGGEPAAVGGRCQNGVFIQPTVITGLGPDCRVNQEEIFGPVVTVMPFRSETEAIGFANGTRYGLSASLWTRDVNRAHRVAEQLQNGTVWVNSWLLRDLRVPFGGMKQSGVGREGGDEAIRFFTETKTVCIKYQSDF
jgi:aminomuconate-semialdehyde/2-hydroxymuconate-6-semialdehyde dehydrogenase